NIVSHPILEYLLKRLQRVQLAAAGFLLGHYLDIVNPTQTLRSSKETTLKVILELGTFQHSTSNVFNSLPSAARNSVVFQ
ncbi:unnamed protein product, partial [Pocillopora meandrina]